MSFFLGWPPFCYFRTLVVKSFHFQLLTGDFIYSAHSAQNNPHKRCPRLNFEKQHYLLQETAHSHHFPVLYKLQNYTFYYMLSPFRCQEKSVFFIEPVKKKLQNRHMYSLAVATLKMQLCGTLYERILGLSGQISMGG